MNLNVNRKIYTHIERKPILIFIKMKMEIYRRVKSRERSRTHTALNIIINVYNNNRNHRKEPTHTHTETSGGEKSTAKNYTPNPIANKAFCVCCVCLYTHIFGRTNSPILSFHFDDYNCSKIHRQNAIFSFAFDMLCQCRFVRFDLHDVPDTHSSVQLFSPFFGNFASDTTVYCD